LEAADSICLRSILKVLSTVDFPGGSFTDTKDSVLTVKGKSAGTFRNVGAFTWAKIHGAGHEVPYVRHFASPAVSKLITLLFVQFNPAVSLQIFNQAMALEAIRST
jgi:hypothetical protein